MASPEQNIGQMHSVEKRQKWSYQPIADMTLLAWVLC